MNKKVVRTAIIYIVSLAVFGLRVCAGKQPFPKTGEQLCFPDSCDFHYARAWYWLCAWPGIFLALFQQVKDKNVPEQNREKYIRGLNKLVRITSIIILILPHIIYGMLWMANVLSQGALQGWGKVDLDASSVLSVLSILHHPFHSGFYLFYSALFHQPFHDGMV